MGQGSGTAVSCGAGRSCGLDPVLLLLWLCCKPAAAALNRPLAWELPYAKGAAQKRKKEKKIHDGVTRRLSGNLTLQRKDRPHFGLSPCTEFHVPR